MLTWVLFILKIIGIILLAVLAFVLILLALLLFWPFHYRLQVNFLNEVLKARVEIFWLLHILWIKYVYPDMDDLNIRVFGFMLGAKEKKGKSPQKKQTKEKQIIETQENEKNAKSEIILNNVETDQRNVTPAAETTPQLEASEPRKGIWKRVHDFIIRVITFFKNILHTIKGLYAKIKSGEQTVQYYIDLWHSPLMQDEIICLKKYLKKIYRNIHPRIVRGNLQFGFEDPSTTGYILAGYYGALYPYIGKHFTLQPEFEKEIFTGDLVIKGHVNLFVLVVTGLRLYFDKQLRQLLKQLKKEN
ncbi:MAG: DUF2953 domain-containing protein [Lachnospiraceae bacterium]|nr:DUF2953 domain-containing protein [Lachnospiraceae bacterium]